MLLEITVIRINYSLGLIGIRLAALVNLLYLN